MSTEERDALECMREAGRIAAAARRRGAALIRPGALVREVCEAVEDEIARRGGGPAFPAQSSRNHVAAHYCPPPDDPTTYEHGDLAKLDLGVQVDGWVVDTATTVNVGDVPAHRVLVEAAEAALQGAIAAAGPGVPVLHLAAIIEATIRARRVRPVANLCGHGVGRWRVHCAPPVPNVPEGSTAVLREGTAVAFEPFATTGAGRVVERGTAEVFRLMDGGGAAANGADPSVLESMRAFRGLPFGRRQLGSHPRAAVEATLDALLKQRRLQAYPPLVEPAGAPVAQAEHTLWVGSSGVEVLTL
jgi:methionyl aminopeptidase